ncbi:bifunctional 2',3'-cyclic-nucleotide 2'-phosphodiesterase/3'-nucleotidase [Tropicibacter sp. Alg240-R139]|uniref:bifunctional 2',3'-cyclic-nucleotide 2'-phosphodiesterase/3'-nucleotidase n=1 Tax=Tropicibacter sp. Alg240-R139 TaxID=2305991 RepID=UPI0013DF8D39|nr:bifunctional 2',3'-cyclic-nucleotide 2'-phosphodiesterase/3'-nucleotidase [Tropicibacter sp. Alg240-R139]
MTPNQTSQPTQSDTCPAGQSAQVRILATSDLHMNLGSFDYYADRPDPSVGLTRIATLIRNARREAERALVLLFDNGDSMQGTPFGDLAVRDTSRRHPLMAAFQVLNYDAIGLGNHDFNFGLKALNRVLSSAPCRVVCSNVHATTDTNLGWQSSVILERSVTIENKVYPIRIGVLSVLPPQTLDWDTHHLSDRVYISDIVDTASDTARNLRQAGCDLVIALAHTGLSAGPDDKMAENAAIPLGQMADVDAVIAGHTHLHLPGTAHQGLVGVEADTGRIHGKPAVMPGSAGSHLGQIDLCVTSDGQGGWAINSAQSTLRPISRPANTGQVISLANEDPELVQLFHPPHIQTRDAMQEPVGRVDRALHSYFTFFAPDHGLALVAAAQAAALRANLTSQEIRGLPLLSAAAPSKFGGRSGPRRYTDVPAGTISMRNVADLHVFPNELSAVIATGRQIRDWLEMSASVFNQVTPGTSGMLLRNREHPGHNFDVIHGLTYEIDITAPARFDLTGDVVNPAHVRICNLCHAGTLVEDDQRFAVALPNYRANGGGNFTALKDAEPIPVLAHRIQQLVRDYVSGTMSPEPQIAEPCWQLSTAPDTQVLEVTGPAARAHLTELPPGRVTDLGLNEDGFLQLSINL